MAVLGVRRGSGALMALLLVAACSAELAPPAAKRSSAPAVRASAAASPAPKSSPAAGARAQVLQPPPGESALLQGRVTIDAGYMVAAGAGNVLSHNGAQLVAAGAGNLIGPDGASLIGADGGTLVAAGGGNIVAAGGGNLIGPDGASLIGADGASLVGADGASYALAQAAAAPALGQTLPAAAMRVAVLDLRTGKPVAVGVDQAGEPVYVVLSNLEGGFALHVPKALAGYVRVVAVAPGTDARLSYDAIVRADDVPDDVDEDTARVGAFLRNAFATRFDQLLSKTEAELLAELEAPRELNPNQPEYYQTLVRPMLLRFGRLSDRRGFAKMDPVRRRAVAQAAADRLLAQCDFSTVSSADQLPTYVPANPDELAIDAMRGAMRDMRERARAAIADEGLAAFAARLAQATRTHLPGARAIEIKKPADLATFVVGAFLSARHADRADIGGDAERDRMIAAQALLAELGILGPENAAGRMRAAGRAIVYHMLYVFKYKDNPDPATIEYGPVGQGIIDYLETVETGVAGAPGAASPAPGAAGGT